MQAALDSGAVMPSKLQEARQQRTFAAGSTLSPLPATAGSELAGPSEAGAMKMSMLLRQLSDGMQQRLSEGPPAEQVGLPAGLPVPHCRVATCCALPRSAALWRCSLDACGP